jgi:hypothetical protein
MFFQRGSPMQPTDVTTSSQSELVVTTIETLELSQPYFGQVWG